jgi:pimeloyl-ACP methyl ester carboxylesterase
VSARAPARIEHATVAANGVRFHVARAGPAWAPLLLCLHGFPECWYSWRHILARLSDRFLVVAPDLRGYGDTERPAGGYDLETLADDAAALVRALGRERCFLAGHDWGGAIAYASAMRHPARVERLVVMNCPHPHALGQAMFRNPRQFKRFWYFLAFQLPWLPERYLARQGGRAIAGSFKAYAHRKERITREDREFYRKEMLKPGALAAALAYYRAGFRSAIGLAHRPRMIPIAAPTLVLWGRRDPALAVELSHGMERFFAGPFAIQYLPDVGHWTQQEAPEEVEAAMRAFLPNSL